MTFIIGFTGGIGSGKTSVTRIFSELGAGVVDTDEIAHELTRPGGVALDEIRAQFGAAYIDEQGALARAEMRQLVFADALARMKLEAILHPLIRREALAQSERSAAPYTLLVVPLLLETGAYRDLIQRLLVVDCPEEQQIERVMLRSNLTRDEVRAIMATQVPRASRRDAADDVLVNDAGPEALRPQVEALHAKYLDLARSR